MILCFFVLLLKCRISLIFVIFLYELLILGNVNGNGWNIDFTFFNLFNFVRPRVDLCSGGWKNLRFLNILWKTLFVFINLWFWRINIWFLIISVSSFVSRWLAIWIRIRMLAAFFKPLFNSRGIYLAGPLILICGIFLHSIFSHCRMRRLFSISLWTH